MLSDWLTRQRKRRRSGVDWLRLDSWIDSSLSNTWEGFQDRWNAASSFFARFRLSGWRRGATELMSEGLTLLVGGLVLMYGLAIPAFQEMDEGKILSTGKYAVKFLDREGHEIGQRGILHNDAVPLEEIPDYLIKATLATEDRRFFEHYGVDVLGTARAFFENVRAGETVQGGSTLTQQLAKNLFLSFERSFDRKLKELFLAFWLESRFTKQQILKLYFDRAYMGGGAYGIEAASQFYFGKSVREVNLAEAAMLAGLFKAPTKFAPHINLPAARARANLVLTNLVDAGFMTAGQVQGARLNPARPIETRATYSPDWYLDWAFEEVQRIAEGRGHYVLTARTTVDVRLQQAADQALVSTIRQYERERNATSGAMVAMDPDGAVRALVGGVDYGESQFNRVSTARRQPGSSFKLYVYANAIEQGLSATSLVRDAAPSCGNWSPKNYDGGSGSGGRVTMMSAFARSLNTTAVDLSFRYERDKVVEMTRRLGVNGVRKTCSMALGDQGITPLEHTAAYAVFANNGKAVKPYAILEIMNSRGDVIYTREKDEPPAEQVLDERVVTNMNRLMQAVVTEGTGRRAALENATVVGKTGTSSSYRDAWFMGFTGQYVTGVWIGNDDFRPMREVTGGNLPAMTWHKFMSVATTSADIPTILGLEPHPAQIEERRRLAALRQLQPSGDGPAGADAAPPSSAMPDRTRQALRQLGGELRLAGERPGGIGSGQPDGSAPVPASGTKRPAPAPGKRAEAPSVDDTAGIAAPANRPAPVQRR
ncbi:MAG: PBP1A family penicillin-binding protein [Hyphomicrobiaceae bacterium]